MIDRIPSGNNGGKGGEEIEGAELAQQALQKRAEEIESTLGGDPTVNAQALQELHDLKAYIDRLPAETDPESAAKHIRSQLDSLDSSTSSSASNPFTKEYFARTEEHAITTDATQRINAGVDPAGILEKLSPDVRTTVWNAVNQDEVLANLSNAQRVELDRVLQISDPSVTPDAVVKEPKSSDRLTSSKNNYKEYLRSVADKLEGDQVNEFTQAIEKSPDHMGLADVLTKIRTAVGDPPLSQPSPPMPDSEPVSPPVPPEPRPIPPTSPTVESAIPMDVAILKGLRDDIDWIKNKIKGKEAHVAPEVKVKTKAPEKKIDPDTGPLAQWEFAESPRFNERGERINAALRARNEVIGSEARKLNGAKYFYEVAERWKKFPLWGKVGVSLGILGAGVAGSVFSPAIAAFAGLSALAWRGISVVGSAAAMGTATYTYLRKRNSRYAGILASLAGVGMGAAVGIGGKYLGEYLNSLSAPSSAPALTWTGGDEIMMGTAAAPLENGIRGVLASELVGPKGLFEPYGFSDTAKSELLDRVNYSLTTNGGYGPELLGRDAILAGNDEVQTHAGDALQMRVLGSNDFTQLLGDSIDEETAPTLMKELESKGGRDGLVTRMREAFAK